MVGGGQTPQHIPCEPLSLPLPPSLSPLLFSPLGTWNAQFCSGSRISNNALAGSPRWSRPNLSISSSRITGLRVPVLRSAYAMRYTMRGKVQWRGRRGRGEEGEEGEEGKRGRGVNRLFLKRVLIGRLEVLNRLFRGLPVRCSRAWPQCRYLRQISNRFMREM